MRYAPFIALALLLVGCGTKDSQKPDDPVNPQQTTGQKPIEGLSRYALGQPISYGNATIVPVILASNKEEPAQSVPEEYISLAEAKKLALVEISEMPTGQEVGQLYVRNLAEKPLLLLAGELLLGGKQDRVVAKDTVVPPGKEEPVPVFCVEHGRWDGPTTKFDYSESMAPQSVREKAVFGSQEEVWADVGGYNERTGFRGSTTSVRGGFGGEEVQSRIKSDLGRFVRSLDAQKGVVGFVYLVNGSIQSFELFGNERLMRTNREPLLKGFLADAAARPSDGKTELDLASVSEFIKKSLTGERNQTHLGQAGAGWNVAGRGARGRELTLPAAEAPARNQPQEAKSFIHGSYAPER